MTDTVTGSNLNLRTLRLLRGVSQAELSESSGVSAAAICEFENGKRDVRVQTLEKLLTSLGVEVQYSLKGRPNIRLP